MIVTLSRHVFGTSRGYQTLASSADVTSDERTELESFSFGQTDDGAYLAALAKSPAYWSRPLRSGRRAVTRVLPGMLDDMGRCTLRFVTVLLPGEHWLRALQGDDAALLKNGRLWDWDGRPELPCLRVEVNSPGPVAVTPVERERVLSLLGAVEQANDDSNATVVATDGQLTPRDVSLLVSVLPDGYKLQFSYGVRSLSEALPVTLNGLAECASRGKSRRNIVRWSPGMRCDGRVYTAALAHFWTPGSEPPRTLVANCPSFGAAPLLPTPTASAPPKRAPRMKEDGEVEPRSRSSRGVSRYAVLACVLVAVVVGTILYVAWTVQNRRSLLALLQDAGAFVQQNPLPTAITGRAEQRVRLLADADALLGRVAERQTNRPDPRLAAAHQNLAEWSKAAQQRAAQYESVEQLLAALGTFSNSLGLDAPRVLAAYPDDRKVRDVAAWKERLLSSVDLAKSLDGPYHDQIQAALRSIEQWEQSLDQFQRDSDTALARVEEFFSHAPPEQLSTPVQETYDEQKRQLADLQQRIESLKSKNGDDVAGLQARLESCQEHARWWSERLAGLHESYEKEMNEARTIIAAAKLGFSPPGASQLVEPWEQAKFAQEAVVRALAVWPDSDEAQKSQQLVDGWRKQAAREAYEHFKSDVEWARQEWQQAEAAAKPGGGTGNPPPPPNPDVALSILLPALEFRDKNRDLIESHDRTEGLQLWKSAIELKSTLDRAKERLAGSTAP